MSTGGRGQLQPGPASLLDTCLHALAAGIDRVDHLRGISEELALQLFDEVIRRGKLSPKA